jgi:hypothetical protein
MTFTEIGALVGFITGVFTVVDRFLVGRPTTMIQKAGVHQRDLYCANTSKQDIIITRIRTSSKYIVVSPHDVAEAGVKTPFTTIVPAGARVDFPIVVDFALVAKEATKFMPFVVMVSWRKTRSMWLPQVPALIFSSIRALRRLNNAKSVRVPED